MNKWDARYLKLAEEVSEWSKDPSRQVGAVTVSESGQVLSTGYNGFPKGIDDTDKRLNHRETKYKYIVHAEMNAIYNATLNGVSLNGATIYIHGLPCCSKCALGLIQVGVKRAIMHGDRDDPRWKDDCAFALELFDESGIDYEFDTTQDNN